MELVILLQAHTKAVVKPVSRDCSPKKWRNSALTLDLGCMADHLLPACQGQQHLASLLILGGQQQMQMVGS
jgi:hypothetical protein